MDLLIEPDELETQLNNPNVVIVDLCKAKQYAQAHIPGAHFVNYGDIVHIEKPVMGLLPDADKFSSLVSSLGITPDTQVVAYDDEGGGCAARFIWTLHVFGHEKTSLLLAPVRGRSHVQRLLTRSNIMSGRELRGGSIL